MNTTKSKTPTKLKPPYGNVTWYKSFFDLIRTRSFERFDKEIIELNIVKRANATMLFNGLRFLGLVEEDGKVTEKFESLRRKGEEFRKNLKVIVEEAFSHLFSKVVVSKAKPDTLFNYFAEYYDYGEATAKLSMKIFVYLCKEAGIELSPELTKAEVKITRKARAKRREPTRDKGKAVGARIATALEGMQKLEYAGRFLMFLRKGDRSTRERVAKIAKQFIDTYVEEEELETEK